MEEKRKLSESLDENCTHTELLEQIKLVLDKLSTRDLNEVADYLLGMD